MDQKTIERIVASLKPSFDDPLFYEQLFESLHHIEREELTEPLDKILFSDNIQKSKELDNSEFQDSWSWRNVNEARLLSLGLIDEQGKIKQDVLNKTIKILNATLYSLGPKRYHDAKRREHLFSMLSLLQKDKKLISILNRISKPAIQSVAERLIRQTLLLNDKETITDAHARQAVLSALFTSLRQNVGSCFATAPAILIQSEQPLGLLKDMEQLLATGSLTRIVEGKEYTVPLSFNTGVADLFRPFYLSSFGNQPWKKLSKAPGIISAMEATGLLSGENAKKKNSFIEKLFLSSTLNGLEKQPFCILTPDELIRNLLLTYYQITWKDVEVYMDRPQETIMSGIGLLYTPVGGGKHQQCALFIKKYEQAKEAFKAITDNALLKAWEFTLASLSESKADFASWNLFASLGFKPEEPEGIGQCFYAILNLAIQKYNQEITDCESRYDHLFAQVKSLEGRINRASSENERGWMLAEYNIRRMELHRLVVERDEAHAAAQRLAHLLPKLFAFYEEKFKEYFQEIYDGEMLDISPNPYDDSPAGFRLLYKHGRKNTAAWTMVHTASEYLQALKSFFIATEIELNHLPEMEKLQKVVSELISGALNQIRRDEFLETSFFRLARAYQEPLPRNPLENLEKVKRKPWAYVSGGNMGTLISCYYGLAKKPEEKARWVESETELLVFLLDLMKEAPYTIQKNFENHANHSLLAFSPTHAFLFKPGWNEFKKGWSNRFYTYTWVRDTWVTPQERFLESLILDQRMMDYFLDKAELFFPPGYRSLFRNAIGNIAFAMTPFEFRDYVVRQLTYESWIKGKMRLNAFIEEFDSLLYTFLPLFPEYQIEEKLKSMIPEISEIDPATAKKMYHYFDLVKLRLKKYNLLSPVDLSNMMKSLLMMTFKTTHLPILFHEKILQAMRSLHYAFPSPILFADTNWVKNVFGFVVNPGTKKLELWRFDDFGSEGRPMRLWQPYVDGRDKREWGVYVAPKEYSI